MAEHRCRGVCPRPDAGVCQVPLPVDIPGTVKSQDASTRPFNYVDAMILTTSTRCFNLVKRHFNLKVNSLKFDFNLKMHSFRASTARPRLPARRPRPSRGLPRRPRACPRTYCGAPAELPRSYRGLPAAQSFFRCYRSYSRQLLTSHCRVFRYDTPNHAY